MKPFDIGLAIAGGKVVTRAGEPVEIIKFDDDRGKFSYAQRVVGIILRDGRWWAASWDEDGKYGLEVGRKSCRDLHMAKMVKSGWLNIYRTGVMKYRRGYIYPSKEEADINSESGRLDCVEVEWEE